MILIVVWCDLEGLRYLALKNTDVYLGLKNVDFRNSTPRLDIRPRMISTRASATRKSLTRLIAQRPATGCTCGCGSRDTILCLIREYSYVASGIAERPCAYGLCKRQVQTYKVVSDLRWCLHNLHVPIDWVISTEISQIVRSHQVTHGPCT